MASVDVGTKAGLFHGVQGRLLSGVGAVVLCTLVAGVLAWIGFGWFEATLVEITDRSVPSALGALRVAQHAGRLDALAPSYGGVKSPEAKAELSARVAEERAAYRAEYQRLEDLNLLPAEGPDVIRTATTELESSLDAMDGNA
ncbi:MAG: hypothetical protein K9H11_17950, partial [Rhodospirillum sp.]|nr:hypothetical protein [Rhodospirillum sp.]